MDRGASEDVPVLIVGGSLVGLSAALFLRWLRGPSETPHTSRHVVRLMLGSPVRIQQSELVNTEHCSQQ